MNTKDLKTIFYDEDQRVFVQEIKYNHRVERTLEHSYDIAPLSVNLTDYNFPVACFEHRDYMRLVENIIENKGKLDIKPLRPVLYDESGNIFRSSMLERQYRDDIRNLMVKLFKPMFKYTSSRMRYFHTTFDSAFSEKPITLIKEPILFKMENPEKKIFEIDPTELFVSINLRLFNY